MYQRVIDSPSNLNTFYGMFLDADNIDILMNCGEVLNTVVALPIDGFVDSIAMIQKLYSFMVHLEVLDLTRCNL